ncbi:MAG: iron ABC transporter permease [Ectothiorhodospiraceae bacterium]|nr:iron ABC transporter permease [Ectothiorhodospiraceae bacterium]
MRAPGGGGRVPAAVLWNAVGWAGFLVLPWYGIGDGFWSFAWLDGYPADPDHAPAVWQVLGHGRAWLAPIAFLLAVPLTVIGRPRGDARRGTVLLASGLVGLAYLVAQGFAIGIGGFELAWLEQLLGPLGQRQYGMGYGALLTAAAFLFLFTEGLAARGAVKGDGFVVGGIGLVVALVVTFIVFPVSRILASAFQNDDYEYAPAQFVARITSHDIWGLGCLSENVACGIAWNSLGLGVMTGASTTALGLAFALLATRTAFPAKRLLRTMTVLPLITPPFVIGLALILLFGVSGSFTQFLEWAFDIPPTRYVYGPFGVWLAQTLAFTPIAFLVLIGVVEGVSPSMEEAAQTLRAGRWKTFTTVSLPLMRPGIANAFLLGFVESLADFGNPLVLGGEFDVLSTAVFFAIVGAQHDQGRAAVLAIVLLVFTLAAFLAQHLWLGNRSYATVTGKGDAGLPPPLPRGVSLAAHWTAIPWAVFTGIIYVMVLFGGFVEVWGLDHTMTVRHYVEAFAVRLGDGGLEWSGVAWPSFFTTLTISAVAAPLTAAVGLLTAWLLVRQRFAGRRAFEFGTMLSFAVPGTVIGVSYILAFNVPPLELTGTGVILVISFVFRNMPVGVRAGVAAMTQLDRSLDEASLTLRAGTLTTIRRVVLPLLRPAIVASLVFSFVRAMTAISAVVFLVSADYDMATSYIIGRVENGDYGLANAYCAVLIVVMVAAIGLVQLLVGQRELGRRQGRTEAGPAMAGGA